MFKYFRMAGSIEDLQTIIKQTAHYLLTPSKSFYKPRLNEVFFDLDDNREDAFSLPKRHLIQMETPEEAYRVVLFNSHARSRSEVVTVRVTESNVRVYRINNVEGDDEEENVPCQISPGCNLYQIKVLA